MLYVLLLTLIIILAVKHVRLREDYVDLRKADGFLAARFMERTGILHVTEIICGYINSLSGPEKERAIRNLQTTFCIEIKVDPSGSISQESITRIINILSERNPHLPVNKGI